MPPGPRFFLTGCKASRHGNPDGCCGQYAYVGSSSSDADWDSEHIRASLEDPRHFTAIFERHADSVHRFLARRAETWAVDDLMSETFVIAFRTRQRYDLAYHDARPWLFGIATNVVHHHRRFESRRARMIGRVTERAPLDHVAPDVTDEMYSSLYFRSQTLRSALSGLDPKYLDVLMLFTGPQFTYEEISRALDIPVGTVRSRLSRGRAQLRELLQRSGQYLGDDVAYPSLENPQ